MRSQQLSYIIYNSINYIYHVVHYTPSTYLCYNWKFVPFDHLHPTPASGTTNLISFCEFVCILIFWSIIDLQHYVVPNAQPSDLIFLYI